MSTLAPISYQVPCRQCPLRPCEVFAEISGDEIDFIASIKLGELRTGPGATILREASPSDQIFTLLEGWAFRYKTLSDGRRQITNFVLPGDLIGLQSSMQGDMDHSVEALTPVALCTFPKNRIWDLFKRCPSLAYDVTWLASRQETMLDEHLLSVGRRNAEECAAYFVLHLYMRARDVGLVTDGKVRFPFTQEHLADALGLSLVHTNKTLRRLSARGLIVWEHGWCFLPDLAALAELAQFDLAQSRKRPLL